MSELFRKTSLEKLSSPEQLDKMIVITPPSLWLALLGAGAIIAVALLWGIFGRLPVNVETQGIYIADGEIYSVYSETPGIVEELVVKEGDEVKKGDVIAYLNEDDAEKKLEQFADRIEQVEKITMESTADAVTADNKGLIEVKAQLMTIDQELYQNQELLKMYLNEIAAQRTVVAAAEKEMQETEINYYNSLNVGDSTSEQLAYTEAQSNLANINGLLESAHTGLDQARIELNQATEQLQKAAEEYQRLEAKEKALEELVGANLEVLNNAYLAKGGSGEIDLSALDSYRGGKWNLDAEVDAYLQAVGAYEQKTAENLKPKQELQTLIAQYQAEVAKTETIQNKYQADVDSYEGEKEAANKNYENTKATYVNRINALGAAQGNQTKLSNTYNMALNKYTTEQTKLDGLLDSKTQAEVQVAASRRMMERQTSAIYSQFEATKAAIIDQLKLEAAQYQDQLESCTVRASVAGKVCDVSVVPGSAVNQGSELLKLQQGDQKENQVVCYVPLNSGKKITEGMEVLVYPTTVNKQEYGHMKAVVKSVDSYVTSPENLRIQLGNDSLVEAFLKDGPVVAVSCELLKDGETSSGYYWSSSKGKDLAVAEGTLVEASVVIEEKAPITMLIPYIKEKMTIKIENEAQ